MSSETQERHAELLAKVAQLERLLREGQAALAASRAQHLRLAQALEKARASLLEAQAAQAARRAEYARTEALTFDRVKGGVEIVRRR